MPKAFLSHKFQDKTIVLRVEKYLKQSLVETWVDIEGMSGGETLSSKVIDGINESQVFIAFISERYFDSNWCPAEFTRAYQLRLNGKIRIIPVLLGDKEQILKKSAENSLINSLLDEVKYIEFDDFDFQKSAEEIRRAVWKPEKIKFKPIRNVEIQGIKLQVISFEVDREPPLPSDYLKEWKFRIEKFAAKDEEGNDDDKPIRFNGAVGFSGAGPNWLYTYLTIPLANRHDIFVFNSFTNDFICVYARSGSNQKISPGITLSYNLD